MSTTPQKPFTLDDLTGNEYNILARNIGGDPFKAMVDPGSVLNAAALCGLLWLRERREQPGLKLEDYLERNMGDVQRGLGLIQDPPAADEDELDAHLRPVSPNPATIQNGGPLALGTPGDLGASAPVPTMADLAADAADELTGEVGAVDPSTPPASRSSDA